MKNKKLELILNYAKDNLSSVDEICEKFKLEKKPNIKCNIRYHLNKNGIKFKATKRGRGTFKKFTLSKTQIKWAKENEATIDDLMNHFKIGDDIKRHQVYNAMREANVIRGRGRGVTAF